jgi:hypothetical protein
VCGGDDDNPGARVFSAGAEFLFAQEFFSVFRTPLRLKEKKEGKLEIRVDVERCRAVGAGLETSTAVRGVEG